ncbi:hypothetical protein Zm00014a_034037 [Zea mays]|uniref:Uncharacterized protein n=2 Tax=Zea mays TaxID=4577 RepID=A0A8J8XR38_MAIZE|nr:hypothetical protein ZEAMMB73_Zm00001d010244 [Zea mays]PWZ09801.1 hypothetical protein Zm00014a_034037 [Zea mays]
MTILVILGFLLSRLVFYVWPLVLAGDPQTFNDDKKAEAQPKGHTGKTVLFVLLGVGAVVLLSFFIFKYWQKKKREEQHARLLKLFEEDDDIEVELGLRD